MQSRWVDRLNALLAQSLDDLAVADLDALEDLVQRFVDGFETPPDRLHGTAVAISLLKLVEAVIHRAHVRRPAAMCDCSVAALRLIGGMADSPGGGEAIVSFDRASLQGRVRQFAAVLAAAHPSGAAHDAAALIRSTPLHPWTLKELEGRVNLRGVRLNAEFRRDFGMRPGEYLHLARVSRAIPLFAAPTKVEAIAWEVGYRSKKDLYAALRRWAGTTPAELRALTGDERDWLWRELRIRLVSVSFAGPDAAGTPGFRQRWPPRQAGPQPHT